MKKTHHGGSLEKIVCSRANPFSATLGIKSDRDYSISVHCFQCNLPNNFSLSSISTAPSPCTPTTPCLPFRLFFLPLSSIPKRSWHLYSSFYLLEGQRFTCLYLLLIAHAETVLPCSKESVIIGWTISSEELGELTATLLFASCTEHMSYAGPLLSSSLIISYSNVNQSRETAVLSSLLSAFSDFLCFYSQYSTLRKSFPRIQGNTPLQVSPCGFLGNCILWIKYR